jgi:hypothetical protein
MRTVLLSTILLSFAAPAMADPTVGLGVSFSFGGGQPQTVIGLRAFSDDKSDEFAGTVGFDYVLGTQSWRGTVGAAYLTDNVYVGADVGYGLGNGLIDFSVGAGAVQTTKEPVAVVEPDAEPVGEEIPN